MQKHIFGEGKQVDNNMLMFKKFHTAPNKAVLSGLTLTLGLVCTVPALAQQADESDPQAGLESIDSPLEEDAPTERVTSDAEPAAVDPSIEDAPADELSEDQPALSDLDRTYAAYSLCVDEAAGALAEAGEAAEVIGVRALAACGEERAAYVNAFYFALLPQAGDTDEPVLRARAGRLVSQTDSFLIAKINEGSAAPTDAEAEADAPPAEDEAASE